MMAASSSRPGAGTGTGSRFITHMEIKKEEGAAGGDKVPIEWLLGGKNSMYTQAPNYQSLHPDFRFAPRAGASLDRRNKGGALTAIGTKKQGGAKERETFDGGPICLETSFAWCAHEGAERSKG